MGASLSADWRHSFVPRLLFPAATADLTPAPPVAASSPASPDGNVNPKGRYPRQRSYHVAQSVAAPNYAARAHQEVEAQPLFEAPALVSGASSTVLCTLTRLLCSGDVVPSSSPDYSPPVLQATRRPLNRLLRTRASARRRIESIAELRSATSKDRSGSSADARVYKYIARSFVA